MRSKNSKTWHQAWPTEAKNSVSPRQLFKRHAKRISFIVTLNLHRELCFKMPTSKPRLLTLSLCCFWVSAVTATTLDSAATATHDVSKACIHVDETAPQCANDATLFAFVGSAKTHKFVQKDNCATCVCGRDGEDEWRRLNNASRAAAADPEPSWGRCCAGWNGTACDVCADVAACPRRGGQKARNCSAGAVEPVAEELVSGKRFSCSVCGPGAASPFCLYPTVNAPSASFDLTAFADHAEVAWRLGTYRADAAKFPGQNDFDYAAYFTGNLTGCQFSKGTCAWDPAKRCLTLKCARTHIDCPPAGLPRCPGWTYDECTHKYVCEHECATKSPTGCCQAAPGTDDDVMHGKRYHVENPLCCPYGHAADDDDGAFADAGAGTCESTEAVWNVVATEFVCELGAVDGAPPSARRCYLNQDHLGDEKGFPFTRGAASESRGAFDSARDARARAGATSATASTTTPRRRPTSPSSTTSTGRSPRCRRGPSTSAGPSRRCTRTSSRSSPRPWRWCWG